LFNLNHKSFKINSNLNNNNYNFNNVENFNYAERVNLTDISINSHRIHTPNNIISNNKVIIKEKIYIEDKKLFDVKYNNNDNFREAVEDTEETGRMLTKQNLTRVSHELEKLRTDVLENHYISKIEKLNKNDFSSKVKKNSKEKSKENINVQNLSNVNTNNNNNNNNNNINNNNNNANRAELKSSSSNRKIILVGGKLPPTGIAKGSVNKRNNSAIAKQSNINCGVESNIFTEGNIGNASFKNKNKNINNNNHLNDHKGIINHELINNLDKSLIKKKKIENDEFSEISKNVNNNNPIKYKNNKEKVVEKSEAGFAGEGEDADIFNMKSTEKSNIDINTNNFDNANNINFFNDPIKTDFFKITEDQDLKMKILQEIDQEEKTEKILTLKLIKNMDRALVSSDEFSIKGDKLAQSQSSNRLSTRINNLKEIKENEKSLNEVNEEEKNFEDLINDNNISQTKNFDENEEEIHQIKYNNLRITNLESSFLDDLTDYENIDNKIRHQAEEVKADEKSLRLENDFKIKNNNVILLKEAKAIDETKEAKTNSTQKDQTALLINRDITNDTANIINNHNTSKLAQELNPHRIENLIKNELTIKISTSANEDLKKTYSEYMTEIDPEQKIIFNISDSIEAYLKGGFPKFILIEDPASKKLISLSTCHYDGNFSTGIRLVLSSFSTNRPENYFIYAEKTILFLNANFPNTEIYNELFYGIQNEKFYVNEKLRDVFSKQLKFRWITLENTGTQRIVKYRLANSEFDLDAVLNGKDADNNSREENKIKSICENVNNLVEFKINTTIAFKECNDNDLNEVNEGALASPREFTKEETDVNIFPAIFLLADLIHKSGFKVNNDNLRLFSNERTRVN
jgi:hypothetical protein